MLDKSPLYSFTLPMTVANTPHNTQREMSGMDIRDVRLAQVIHGGISELNCADHQSFVHPQQQPRKSLHGMSPRPTKQVTSNLLTMHSTPDDITSSSDQPCVFLKQAPTTTTPQALIKWANHPSRLNGNKSLDAMAVQLQQARHRLGRHASAALTCLELFCMFMLSQISRFHSPWSCLTAIGSRTMFSSTPNFEYNIVAGLAFPFLNGLESTCRVHGNR